MKLINKTQRVYLILIAVLILVGIGLLIGATLLVLRNNVDEALQSSLHKFIEQAQNRDSLPALSIAQISITPLAAATDTTTRFSDTTMFNSVEREPFAYRQITTQAKIGGQPYKIVLRRAKVETDDLFEAILIVELIFAALLIAGLFIINKSMLQKIWSPFYHALQQITRYKIGRQRQLTWHKTDIDEFRQMNAVLKNMITHIEKEYKSLKQFTENASHEIQTPLAVINSRIEVLLQKENFNKTQWKSLGEIYRAAGRLSRLNRALLLLTKIENRQFTERKQVEVNALLNDLLCNYEELITRKNLKLSKNPEDKISINANPDLIELLLRNVLSNAIKHNIEDGQLTIHLSANHLRVENTGAAPKEEVSHYFERFYKKNSDSASLGLGLAIIKEICGVNDFECDYSYADGLHIMKIWF
jgi:signal transduction histidine kinase